MRYGPQPWRDAPVAQVAQAYDQAVANLGAMSRHFGKPIVCTEIGFRSSPWSYATVAPGIAGTVPHVAGSLLDPSDCSVTSQCASLNSTVIGLDAFLSRMQSNAWYRGSLVWMWRTDPTAGGTSDATFTLQGKPAPLDTLQRYWAAG